MTENSGEKIHPAYQEILDVLPESLHSVVIPTLKKWDQGVQTKFQEIHTKYEEYKAFEPFIKNNIDPAYIEQAVTLADQLQRDPQNTVAQINEAWQLGFSSKEEVEQLQSQAAPPKDEGDLDFGDNDDILKHPKVKELYETVTRLQTDFQTTKEQEESDYQLQQFESYLDDLEAATKEQDLPFNRTFVTALISQGIEGEDAVKQYHEVLASSLGTQENPEQTNTTQTSVTPPVVMGGDGTGSGTPENNVNFGELSSKDLNAAVAQMIQQANENSQ